MNKIKFLALLFISSIFLTACTLQDLPVIGKYLPGGSGNNDSGDVSITTDPVEITVWGLWENNDVMNAAIAAYKIKRPNVTVNYEDRSVLRTVDYKERVYTRSSQSTGPDVMLVHNGWVGEISQFLSPAPSSVITPDQYRSKFFPVAADSAVINNSVYGVPFYYDGLVLVYNVDHFEQIGQATPPTAWEEFRKLALELSVRNSEGALLRGGAALGTANNVDHFSDILGLMWSQAGVSVPDGLDTKAAADALEFYTNFAKEDRVWNSSLPEATTAFIDKRVSMIFVPSWQIANILDSNPDFRIGVAVPPQARSDQPANWGSFWMYVVSSNSPNSLVAWDFINFLTQDEQQMLLFNEASKVRYFGAPYSTVSLQSQLLSNEILGPVLQTAQTAKGGRIASRSGNRKEVDALSNAVSSVLSGGNAQQALSEAKATIR